MYATEGYSITEKQVCAGGEMNKVILLLIFDGRDKRLNNALSDNLTAKSPKNHFVEVVGMIDQKNLRNPNILGVAHKQINRTPPLPQQI